MNKPQNQQGTPQGANEPDSDTPVAAPYGSPDNSGSDEIAREAAQIAGLHEQIADLKDRYLRAAAETENVRRRAEREKVDAAQYAFASFAREMLKVADNFARAMDALKPEVRSSLPATALPVIEGIEATQRELNAIFERHKIRPFESKGQRFNPNIHEAIAEIPSADVPAGHIIDVVQSGYMIGDRLLRAAMVAVAAQTQGAQNGSGPAQPGSVFDAKA